MEFAGVFLTMVAVRPWKGPSGPLCLKTDLTQPETDVNAAVDTHDPISAGMLSLRKLHDLKKKSEHDLKR